MARYLVQCVHVPEDCTVELDSVLGMSRELLHRFDWGCKAGEHVGWAVIEAQDEPTARMLLPSILRTKAHVTQLNKFSAEEIASMKTH